jgi:ubiquinone/menaquinone biosynthesis C-methylase UbiE
MFLKRYAQPELMDDFLIQDERIDLALRELRLINYFLGGNTGSKRGVAKMIANLANEKIYLLDAGSGSSDVLNDLKKKHKSVQVISLDRNKRVCNFIKKNNNFKPMIVCADALFLPFKNKSIDIIHTSLFLHHFDNKSLKIILKKFGDVAKQGLVINDLRRSLCAFGGIKILTLLFSKSELVKYDAPVSVRKGFIKSELIELLNEIQFINFEMGRKWAFRWVITAQL